MHAEPKPAPDSPEEDSVPPGDDSNTDPTPPLPADHPGRNGGERNPSASAPQKHLRPLDEEPEINKERDIPSDGRDPEGEAMIRDLDKPTEPSGDKPTGQAHGH
ncbi:MAG: hypothetical protein Q8O29_09060 [Polaromonas sp.]|uniref:hypothetical protein n=1 Tax=Polaromonas sp. TaxID=1869339 RepID=UPI002735ED0D|nr:hypothetical protein [Polaromonas sp.]MDP2818410.1 hypothetical protein [Polaromonas sp.]